MLYIRVLVGSQIQDIRQFHGIPRFYGPHERILLAFWQTCFLYFTQEKPSFIPNLRCCIVEYSSWHKPSRPIGYTQSFYIFRVFVFCFLNSAEIDYLINVQSNQKGQFLYSNN